MKKILYVFALCIFCFGTICAQGVSINATGVDPDTSAMLDVASVSKGILIPRLTTIERDNILLPSFGLLIYNKDVQCFEYYTGTTWLSLCGRSSPLTLSPSIHVYTSNTTWVKPPGLKYVVVEVVAGGGGGGGASLGSTTSGGGGGGGGGGYCRKIISASSLNISESIVIGIGGLAGSPGNDGTSGGASNFGSYCSATGGTYGEGTNSAGFSGSGGSGGIGGGGDLNCKGQGGSAGNGGGGSSVVKQSGAGGSSVLGGGGESFSDDGFSISGTNGGQYGGGGSGGYDHPSGAAVPGGAGAPGVVIVTEYY